MGKNPVVHFEIAGADFGKAKDFYAKVFEWEIQGWEGGPANYGYMSHSGEGTIGGGLMQFPPEVGRPYLTFYIQVDDLKTFLEKIEANGGKTLMPPTPIPGVGSSAMFSDPDGVVIGLYCDKQEV